MDTKHVRSICSDSCLNKNRLKCQSQRETEAFLNRQTIRQHFVVEPPVFRVLPSTAVPSPNEKLLTESKLKTLCRKEN